MGGFVIDSMEYRYIISTPVFEANIYISRIAVFEVHSISISLENHIALYQQYIDLSISLSGIVNFSCAQLFHQLWLTEVELPVIVMAEQKVFKF